MGYGSAPWEFRGQALYQLSLVKVEEARKYAPPELPLVNFFGWTLGGFYLARYSHSPAGAFDELVALAGLAWDFPTSCAWAARVFVNNRAARDHGVSAVGLPSRLATFKAVPLPALRGNGSGQGGRVATSWWDQPAVHAGVAVAGAGAASLEIVNCEGRGGLLGLSWTGQGSKGRGLSSPVCAIEMPQLRPAWAPRIQLFLPSFSGATPDFPGLLKYSLRLMTHVRLVKPVRVQLAKDRAAHERQSSEVLDAVLGGRPLLCMAFDDMVMEVQAPQAWTPHARKGVAQMAAA